MFSFLLILFLVVVLIIPVACALLGVFFGLFLNFSMACYGIIRLKEYIDTLSLRSNMKKAIGRRWFR